MKRLSLILLAALSSPVLAQTMYKCPDPSGVVKFQQTPCTPTGGGEVIEQKAIKSTGGTGLSNQAQDYLDQQSAQRAERNKLAEEEVKRQQALNVERDKARAAHEQAAAQRETARAIWATGRR